MPDVIIARGMAQAFKKALNVMKENGCSKSQDVVVSECGSRMYVPLSYSNKLVFLAELVTKINFKGVKKVVITPLVKEKKPRTKKKFRGTGAKSIKRKKRQAIAAERHK